MTLHLRMQHHHQKGQAWVPTQACKPALLDPLLNISSFSYQPHHNFCFGSEQVLKVGQCSGPPGYGNIWKVAHVPAIACMSGAF